MLLSDVNLKDTTLEQFVADSERADGEVVILDSFNEAVVDIDSENEEDFLMASVLKSQQQTQSQPLPRLHFRQRLQVT